MSEETKTKMKRPTVGEDGMWIEEIQGDTLRFREATFDERSMAENLGGMVAPNAPVNPTLGLSNEQLAQLLGLIVQRRNQKGVWEPLTRQLIGKRKDIFFFMTLGCYLAGLSVIGEETRNLSLPLSEATSPIAKSETSVRP